MATDVNLANEDSSRDGDCQGDDTEQEKSEVKEVESKDGPLLILVTLTESCKERGGD